MRIAFYAPLKPPDHPIPSGDRQIARLLLKALATAGHETTLVSRFRTFDRVGDRERQLRMRSIGTRLATRLVERLGQMSRPDLWLTYHVHHKAPDLLGRAVTDALGIPYVIAEASVAQRQREGPWAAGYADALAAIRGADTIVSLNPADVAGVVRTRAPGAGSDFLAPFIDVTAFRGRIDGHATRASSAGRPVRLVTVGMMREGAKLASYRVLALALARLRNLRWSLRVVGDGPARREVEQAFGELRDRVTFVGARSSEDIPNDLADSDLLLWPAIDEAFGVTFLEAQACGVPVVGAATPGVAAVVAAGRTGLLAPVGDIEAFASATRELIVDDARRLRMGEAAQAYVRTHHDLPLAAAHLDQILHRVVARRAVVTP
jgi:glycosyltransferase involved in cell wall biosynthesis